MYIPVWWLKLCVVAFLLLSAMYEACQLLRICAVSFTVCAVRIAKLITPTLNHPTLCASLQQTLTCGKFGATLTLTVTQPLFVLKKSQLWAS